MNLVHHLVRLVKLLGEKHISHSDFKTNNILVRASGDVVLADFGCVCSTMAATIGKHDYVVPLGDLGDKEHAWRSRQFHSHPVARTSLCTSIADQYAFIVMASEVLYGPRSEVCRSLQKHKVFLPDHARASKVHSVLPCFVDVALNVVGTNRVFNPVTIINACEQASGPLVPLKM